MTPQLTRIVPFTTVMRATVVKDLQIARRYIPDLVGRVIELGVRVLFFMMLSNVISVNSASSPLGHALAGRDLMIFFQGALVLFVFNSTALAAPVDAVNRDLYNGTLEYLYVNPSSRYGYFAGSVVASAFISLAVFLPVFILLVIFARANVVDTVLLLAVCGVTLIAVVAMGVMVSLLAILWRQTGSITAVLSILFEMLAGAYFPVMAFPASIKYLSFALPYTWAYDLIRYYSFAGRWKPLLPVPAMWLILIAFAALFTVVSRILLQKTERQAKKNGLHLI